MALDDGYHLAPLADTPYDSHPMDVPKQSSLGGSSVQSSHRFPVPPLPSDDSWLATQHGTTDDGNVEWTSARESRRLTPNNLGVSLVAQIHSLRFELGGKDSIIESLEEIVHKSRAENEQLTQDLKTQTVEVTSVKKQMHSLEKDLLQALEDIAKERDFMVEKLADTRRRLDESKKSLHVQEENADKARAFWEKDKENWDDTRRKMESRVRMVEERLKAMVAEMLNVQSTEQKNSGMNDDLDEDFKETWFSDGNDPLSNQDTFHLNRRSLDESYEDRTIPNFRSSRMSGLHDLGGSHTSGLSLAEELELGEGEDVSEEEDFDQNALPEEIHTSMRRYPEGKKAKKVMGFHIETYEEPFGDEISGQQSIGIINDYIDLPGKQHGIHYTDAGTQFSPPSPPSLQRQEPGMLESCIEQTEPAANERRKRIPAPTTFVDQPLASKAVEPKALSMISTGCQTSGSPEGLASSAEAANEASVSVPFRANEMNSGWTQTTEDVIPATKPASSRLSPSPMDVPVIAIHPPASSRPSSSRNSVMLPPRTKNAACQVEIELPKNYKSISMQTEEAKINERPNRISPRSSASPTQTPSRLAEKKKKAGNISVSELSKHSLRNPPLIRAEGTQPEVKTARVKDAYPGNNDDGPLNHKQSFGPRRPIRSESIFAGFGTPSDDDPAYAHDQFSDDDFLSAAPIRKTLSKVQNSWKLVPHLKDSVLERLESASEEGEDKKHVSAPKAVIAKAKPSSQTTSKTFQTRSVESYRTASSNVKQSDIRRKALISNGIAQHAQRGGNPSDSDTLGTEATLPPPFPVPKRSSSRKPLSASDGAASPSPHNTTFSASHDHNRDGPLAKRGGLLRKVQSAATVTQQPAPLRPQPTKSLSASSTVPASPKTPAPRRNQFILPYGSVAELPSHSVHVQTRAGENLIETPTEQTSVVDAIAQTMVGEWMWKYMRKRTSFGITESSQAEFDLGRHGDSGNGSGVRHKRWVWLAPFERAVMWSSKQPTSGPALLGKGARKLAIRSVLDVKDDAPLPKNAGFQGIYDRSILILTPQRALKFTAMSRERHYIWLAALSHLSHATRSGDDLTSALPLPKHEGQHRFSQERMSVPHRTAMQDSIGTARVIKRPSIGAHSYSTPTGLIEQEIIEGARLPWEDEEAESDDAAEPPQVHRVAAQARKHSGTGPRAVPLSAFHIHPNNVMAMGSTSSLQGPTSGEKYDGYRPQPGMRSGAHTMRSTLTRSITESSIVPSPVVPDNFFDCAGTVRMEAFVDDRETDYILSSRGKSQRARQGGEKDMSLWGSDASVAGSGWGSAREKGEDPFTGF